MWCGLQKMGRTLRRLRRMEFHFGRSASRTPSQRAGRRQKGRKIDFVGLQGAEAPIPRRVSGIAEFDRVCGGGLVSGSALLVGGDPGIGKSTLLLQAVGQLAARHSCAYVSGEEAVDQVRLRAKRLGLEGAKVGLASATNVRDICATFDDKDAPEVVVIDLIQTMYVDNLDSAREPSPRSAPRPKS